MAWHELTRLVNELSTESTTAKSADEQKHQEKRPEQGSLLAGSTRFDFILGLRGFLALLVVYAHIAKFYSQINLSNSTTLYMSVFVVSSFFILSAYLLTRATLSQMFELKQRDDLTCRERNRELFLIVCVFFIRRTFRLYVPYLIVCTLISFGPKFFGNFFKH
jgi:peptidoglycan/LPS O-acetylase OafA/YrhL